jgi:hypothetical protein
VAREEKSHVPSCSFRRHADDTRRPAAACRQALTLFGGGTSGPLTATAAVAARTTAPPRWDWPTQLEIRLFRGEVEALLK